MAEALFPSCCRFPLSMQSANYIGRRGDERTDVISNIFGNQLAGCFNDFWYAIRKLDFACSIYIFDLSFFKIDLPLDRYFER